MFIIRMTSKLKTPFVFLLLILFLMTFPFCCHVHSEEFSPSDCCFQSLIIVRTELNNSYTPDYYQAASSSIKLDVSNWCTLAFDNRVFILPFELSFTILRRGPPPLIST